MTSHKYESNIKGSSRSRAPERLVVLLVSNGFETIAVFPMNLMDKLDTDFFKKVKEYVY